VADMASSVLAAVADWVLPQSSRIYKDNVDMYLKCEEGYHGF
jgi:hypothetical protein